MRWGEVFVKEEAKLWNHARNWKTFCNQICPFHEKPFTTSGLVFSLQLLSHIFTKASATKLAKQAPHHKGAELEPPTSMTIGGVTARNSPMTGRFCPTWISSNKTDPNLHQESGLKPVEMFAHSHKHEVVVSPAAKAWNGSFREMNAAWTITRAGWMPLLRR